MAAENPSAARGLPVLDRLTVCAVIRELRTSKGEAVKLENFQFDISYQSICRIRFDHRQGRLEMNFVT